MYKPVYLLFFQFRRFTRTGKLGNKVDVVTKTVHKSRVSPIKSSTAGGDEPVQSPQPVVVPAESTIREPTTEQTPVIIEDIGPENDDEAPPPANEQPARVPPALRRLDFSSPEPG